MTDLSLLQILLANLALLAGACLQGVAGYGIGTLAAPLLFLISPMLIPAPLVLNAVVLTIFMLLRNRGALQVREVRFAIGGGVGGMILAGITLMLISPTGFELAFGVLILLGVLLSAGGLRPALNARNSILAGAASTYMGTITAVGGPPIALIYQNEKGPLVRANMSAFSWWRVFSVLPLWWSPVTWGSGNYSCLRSPFRGFSSASGFPASWSIACLLTG